ncbi:tRNA(Ile)-lysidine synthase [Buchnera aphidicola (Nipponaphis monzeni)]|uniref:tRNA(Ile)-lysidine synthase n=1 Tax=Buchnera aphidicola (Nipponaphis monzeni) TaxID=2495405 RepID=A0A455T9S8_9GAMM|nr:tRNA lysidine(34) synthetase TilS [Buchnera aphidicola]BBI01107.1 tRNA(Ile)-lysidine synthase [Buchnera aphidicola (Nipponaphis monzeni)]
MIKHIFKYITFNSSILIAYSGGIDSTVLLHQFINLKKNNKNLIIRAIHINHNMDYNSDKWVQHCKEECKRHSIPIVIETITKKITSNIECQLRTIRYTLIKKCILPQEVLVTAHHLNDQVETMFLALKRGSGPNGLKGITECSNLGHNKIIRPLLKVSKTTIQNWAKKKKLLWITDHSNNNIKYDRNFLRLKVIPIIDKRWPSFIKSCLTTANICKNTEVIVKNVAKNLLSKYILNNLSLKVHEFIYIAEEYRNLILREWIYKITKKYISYKKIQKIYYEVINSKNEANPKLVFYKYQIRKYRNIIYCIPDIPLSLKNLIIFWHNPTQTLVLPFNLGKLTIHKYGNQMIQPNKNDLINIRFQYQGKLSIVGRHKKRTFKKILQELSIPPWKREITPLLFYNNKFISAIGIFVNKQKLLKENKMWTICWDRCF